MKNIRLTLTMCLVCCVIGAADLSARTHYLPDYQAEISYGNRINSTNSGHTSKQSCSTYGFYAASDRPAGVNCSRVNSPAPGLECYSCGCSSEYIYNSDNCSGNYTLSGSSCSGKYDKCICNPTLFPTTSSGTGCPDGKKADMSASCTNKSDGITVYECKVDSCYGLVNKNTCETQGNYCVSSSQCADGCEQCLERCEGYKIYEGAVDTCDLGCAPGKEISGCSGLCVAGGCKTCTPCGDEYVLASALPPNVLTQVCTDCDGTTKHMPIGCQTGYADSKTYWCSVPQSTECAALGYTLNKTCSSSMIMVRCPFNSSYVACL